MEKIKILQVIGIMDIGGAETFIMNILRSIDRTKFQLDFVVHTDDTGKYDDEIKKFGSKIYHIKKFSGKNYFSYKKQWHELFSKYTDYEIVHGHIGSTASIYLSIAKKYGMKTIAHSHSTGDSKTLKGNLYKVLTYRTRWVSDMFFSCSTEAGNKRYGKKITRNENKHKIMNNGIILSKYLFSNDERNKIREINNIKKSDIVIGHVGRFSEVKNHKKIISIFKKLYDIDKKYKLILVGDGPLKKEIQKEIISLDLLENVIFTGLINNVNEYLFAMDIFLFPSFYEGLPTSVIESQATGLKSLISDTISEEVDITDLITRISLKESDQIISKKINSINLNYNRINYNSIIKEKGYDIIETTLLLQDIYVSLVEGTKNEKNITH